MPGLEAITGVGTELGGLQFRPWTIEGRLPRSGEAGEMAITEVTGQQLDLSVGDVLDMRYFDPETGEACREGDADACESTRSAGPVRIVGVVRTATDLAVNSFQQNVFVADRAFADRLGDEPPVSGTSRRSCSIGRRTHLRSRPSTRSRSARKATS